MPTGWGQEIFGEDASKATVNLQIRPLDVPLSWTYHLDNPVPELESGESTTVNMTLDPGGRNHLAN